MNRNIRGMKYINFNLIIMKTLNLFFDFEFTGLSPDAQPISLGIISDEIISGKEV